MSLSTFYGALFLLIDQAKHKINHIRFWIFSGTLSYWHTIFKIPYQSEWHVFKILTNLSTLVSWRLIKFRKKLGKVYLLSLIIENQYQTCFDLPFPIIFPTRTSFLIFFSVLLITGFEISEKVSSVQKYNLKMKYTWTFERHFIFRKWQFLC